MPRLSLPRAIEMPTRHPFPLLASLAPVVGSIAIWAITSSPFALVFAFLGPVIAIASMADARVQGRKETRRERARFASDVARLNDSIDRAHGTERARLRTRSPGSLALLDGPVIDPERWRGSLAEEVPITVGRGRIRSELTLDGESNDDGLELLVARSRLIDDAPVVVDARLGIGICGPEPLAAAVARGIVLQLATTLAPEETTFTAPAEWAELLDDVPQSFVVTTAARVDTELAHGTLVVVGVAEGRATSVVAIGSDETTLPATCRVVISIDFGRRARVVRHPRPELMGDLDPEYVSRDQAAAIAVVLNTAAAGRCGAADALPLSLALAELPQCAGAGTLPTAFLVDAAGPVVVDLVRSGPHAVIGGMTGSGKSELLVSWLLAIATCNPPSEVCFLLVDFKGGASFAPVVGLPHVVGLVTDLDERSAHRALQSLSAEIRFRERAIADAGVRSVDDPNISLPRLVIVVDEFAALVAGFHELHELFADVAARGRSLGIHLILCTQRPAGVVRDSVLANVPLRLSLRVNNRADSTAVVGTDAAAALPAAPPGRAVLALDGIEPRLVQVALASPLDATRLIERWRGHPVPRRPWRDDLPAAIAPRDLADVDAGFPFALLDLPEEQRQSTAAWNPATQGSLFIVGAGGSGKSVALATLAAAARCRAVDAGTPVDFCALIDSGVLDDRGILVDSGPTVVVLPPGIEAAWDLITSVVDRLRRGTAGELLLVIDDVDALLARFGDEHEQPFTDLLLELVRSGGGVGIHLALSARRISGGVQSISNGCDARVILRLPNRQDHLLAGGATSLFSADAVPGRGEWRGAAIQVASTGIPLRESAAQPGAVPSDLAADGLASAGLAPFDWARWPTVIAVTSRPEQLRRILGPRAERLDQSVSSESPRLPVVIVGDVDGWSAQWQRMSTLRMSAPILFDRCTVAEFRAVSGQRRLPPPIDQYSGSAWLLEPGGALSRVTVAQEPPLAVAHTVTG